MEDQNKIKVAIKQDEFDVFYVLSKNLFISYSQYIVYYTSFTQCEEIQGLSRTLIIMHSPAQMIVYRGAGLCSPLSRLCGNW